MAHVYSELERLRGELKIHKQNAIANRILGENTYANERTAAAASAEKEIRKLQQELAMRLND